MDIQPVDKAAPVLEHTTHEERRRPRNKRQLSAKGSKSRPGVVYKPNGELDQVPTPSIDVLV
jgi:hypothetical protein